MRITDFEKNFLGIDGGNDEFNPYVIRLFHTLLQKVESQRVGIELLPFGEGWDGAFPHRSQQGKMKVRP